MKAICVTEGRTLEVRAVPTPADPPAGHILVDMDSATITHGDRLFLTRPLPGGGMSGGTHDVYGSNGGGRVVAIGKDVPTDYLGKQVAIYKTLVRSPHSVGLWCETAMVPHGSCLILPDDVAVRDYNGSFANVLTVHAFLSEIIAAGHRGIIVTAGTSATGLIAASLTRRHNIPAVFLVRSRSAHDELVRHGVENVIVTTDGDFEERLAVTATGLNTTAVFDGIGGDLLSRILPALPLNSTVYVYGFMGGPTPISLPTMLVMANNLTLRRFANLESPTVSDPHRLARAMKDIEGLIDDPLFKTRIGREFAFDEIEEAMAYEGLSGERAILVP